MPHLIALRLSTLFLNTGPNREMAPRCVRLQFFSLSLSVRAAVTTKFFFLSCLRRCILSLMEIAKRSEPPTEGICYILRTFPAPSIVTKTAMSKMNSRMMAVLTSPPTLVNEISHFTFLLHDYDYAYYLAGLLWFSVGNTSFTNNSRVVKFGKSKQLSIK